MVTRLESLLHAPHAEGETGIRQRGYHLRCDLLTVPRCRCVLGGDTVGESTRKMREDGKESVVFVETREGFGGELRRWMSDD
jgi:hypothetical protein